MTNNINTNPAALLALQNLSRVNELLELTQRRVSTGLEISSAKDNPTLFTMAQQQRAELASLESVEQGLRVGISTVDVAVAAAESVADILVKMRALASQATDASLSSTDRTNIQNQYAGYAAQLGRVVDGAEVGGRNLIESGATNMSVIAEADGSSSITVTAQVLAIGATGTQVTLAGTTTSLATTSAAQTELALVDASIANVSSSISSLAGDSSSLTLQNQLITRLTDSLEISIGTLVDADLPRESSRLQALQVQQQLAIQTLSIANAAPNSILALFA